MEKQMVIIAYKYETNGHNRVINTILINISILYLFTHICIITMGAARVTHEKQHTCYLNVLELSIYFKMINGSVIFNKLGQPLVSDVYEKHI